MISSALIAHQAIRQTTQIAQNNIVPVVTASVDLELLLHYDEMPSIDLVSNDTITTIGNFPYVSFYETSLAISPLTRLDSYIPDSDAVNTSGLEGGNLLGEFNFFWMTGISNPRMIYVAEGLFELIEGRLFNEEELVKSFDTNVPTPILLPIQIAELNGLHIGSVITLYQEHFDIPENAQIPEGGFFLSPQEVWDHEYSSQKLANYDFEVIGLLDIDFNEATHMEAFHMQLVVYNTVFVPNWKIERMIIEERESLEKWRTIFNREGSSLEERFAPSFFWVLNDVNDLDDFISLAQPLLPDYYKIDAWDQVNTPLNSSLMNLNWLSLQILYFSSGAMMFVLYLLISLFLRERKIEFGIYRALGESKTRIVLQIIFEMVPIVLLSMCIAFILGRFVADLFSTHFLLQELSNTGVWTTGSSFVGEWQEFSQLEFMGFGREKTLEELIDLFHISIDTRLVIIYFIVGLTTTLTSIIASSLQILKSNVKEILLKSNVQ